MLRGESPVRNWFRNKFAPYLSDVPQESILRYLLAARMIYFFSAATMFGFVVFKIRESAERFEKTERGEVLKVDQRESKYNAKIYCYSLLIRSLPLSDPSGV